MAAELSEPDKIEQEIHQNAKSGDNNADVLAIIALICGIAGLCFGLPAIAAIITGNMAVRKGSSLGRIGLILGYIGIALFICGVIGYLVYFSYMRTLSTTILQGLPTP